jgi:cytochrome c biogenesis protein CcdA
MAGTRHDARAELATLETAYRKSRRTVIGHTVFFVVCCTIAVILRHIFRMPPALLSVVFGVALVLFGGDVFRFLSQRRRLRQMRENLR